MKKLLLLLFACGMFTVTDGFCQEPEDPVDMNIYLDASISLSKKQLRKHRRKLRVHREVDSLIVYRKFQFETVARYRSVSPGIASRFAEGSRRSFARVNGGDFYSHVYKYKPGQMPAQNFKFTNCTKEENNTWLMTIELDLIDEKQKYEFVIQPEKMGWGVMRITSNQWVGQVVYTGWLMP